MPTNSGSEPAHQKLNEPEGAPSESEYVDRVRASLSDFSVSEKAETDARAALAALEGLFNFDVDVPTESDVPGGRLAKDAVRRMIRWYLLHLSRQMTAFAHAVTHLEALTVKQVARLEQDSVNLRERTDWLEERLERLERGGSAQT
jgi:hypothetical protein